MQKAPSLGSGIPMRWPWVSRLAFEMLGNERAYAQHVAQKERLRYDALLDKYHALKVAGATVSEPRQPVEAKEPDAVQWAINEKAGNNHALRLHLTGYAARERLNQVPDEEIVSRLTKWQSETDD